jgi:hypothetical protein
MDIAGFVGQAERGPLNYPQPITSWGQFREIFGEFVGFSYLPYAVFGFFLNDGERCYVVRVAHEDAAASMRDFIDRNNDLVIRVEAINKGDWGDSIEVEVGEQSTDDLELTKLDNSIGIGQHAVMLKSVAGLVGVSIAGSDSADRVTLVHGTDPSIREEKQIDAINFGSREVSFTASVSNEFPAGSSVFGKGFKLTFRHWKGGKNLREEVFDNLSMDETSDRYFVTVINGYPEERDYVKRIRNGNSILVRVEDLSGSMASDPSRPVEVEGESLGFGDNGTHALDVCYYTGIKDGSYFRPHPSDESEAKLNGLAAFEAMSEIGLIAIPDLIISVFDEYYESNLEAEVPGDGIIFNDIGIGEMDLGKLREGQLEMLRHCEKMGDRFAILDSPPGSQTGTGVNRIENWPGHLQLSPNAKYGALYYPWIKQRASDSDGRELFIPPSGHVAGIYARSEQQQGIGKAPANEILRGVIELEFCLTDTEQDILNPRGVNCLRALPGRGLRVWGARTLSSELLWRYVNVRRVCLWIIKNILVNLQWTVFEPNDQRLWDRITTTLTLFFQDLLRQGALAGTAPEEAFFVKCNEETNTSEVVDRGWVITEIGFAPAYPAEFVMVTVKRTAESISVSEQ